MSKKLEIVYIILILCISIDAKNSQDYEFVPNEFIIKLSPETKIILPNSLSTGIIEIDRVLSKISVDDISPVVPYKKNLDPRLPDINRIYRIRYFDNLSPDKVAEEFNNLNNVIYSEPRYIQYETTVPNDPYYSNQWHLPVIDASQAWNITTGDTNVIIAIVDDAVDLDHEDLADNIFTNWIEYHGTDGIDDDFNGYVDDVHGWDFAENNNDPNPAIGSQDHGTHVAGCASVVTDNGIGVAAPGWKCKILPLKFSNDNNGSLSGDAAAAIIYAADMGAALTNNSYGGGGFSNYFLDAFLYAYELGTLSITSAGNSDENESFYPASYHKVLSVASTASGDYKSGFSTYHLSVDISSPGSGILSSVPDNDYASFSGTSMASPVAAGIAGLIKSQYPDLTPSELAIRLSATADNIYDINPEYYLLLGSGRVNANNAVTYSNNQFNTIPVRMGLANFSATDLLHGNGDSAFDPGETIDMDISLYNYSIMGSENVNVYLTSADSRINIIEGTILNLNVLPEDTLFLDQAFSLSINDSADVGICVFNISIQQGGQNLNSFELSINIGKTPILIVDDDGGGSTDKFYTTILDSMGVPYSLWDRMNGPLSYQMVQNSPILIWFTEWSFPTLDYDDREVIMEYLDNGGNLYVSGQDLGWELNEYPGDSSQTAFFYNYLHADWGGDDAGASSAQGVPGNSISDGMSFDIYQPGYPSANQYPDYFTPHEDADLIFKYSNELNMGLSYKGDYRLVYTGTGLETFGSNSSSTAPNDINETQTLFMERALNYLNFINHTPLVDNEDSTSSINFHVNIFNDGADFSVPFLYYRLNGGEFNMVEMRDTTEGFYYTVPPPNESVLVEYYFSVNNNYYNWTNPINTDEVFQFSIGRDMIVPDVYDLAPLPNLIDRSGVANVSVLATDNIGVDSVSLYWYYSFDPEVVHITPMNLNGYFWEGNVEWESLSGNDKVFYFAVAKDSSSNANLGYSDTLSFQIINKTILTTWDEEIIGLWDTGQSWGLFYVNSAVKYGMNDSPSLNYENNKSDYLTLMEPFDLSDYNSAYLQFWTGSFLRDNDIGTIQISGDGSIWESVYSISGINFVDTVKIDVTEYIESDVHLRFHISTDASEVASGWYIDDIHLLVDTSLVILSSDYEKNIPINFYLSQNYPNPFNPITSIDFFVPKKQMVKIEVIDLKGRLINTIHEGITKTGEHTVRWNAADYNHNPISTGVYFYRLTSGNYFKTRKMLYLK